MTNNNDSLPSNQGVDKITLIAALKEKNRVIDELQAHISEPIAIIGMSCKFPGDAKNVDGFWQMLSNGIDGISPMPTDRLNVDSYYDPDPDAPHKMYTKEGGFLSAIDEFDAEFFKISPREALALDPQQRLLLEVSWEALEDARINVDTLTGSKFGVYVGMAAGEYQGMLLNFSQADELESHIVTGNAANAAAGRLSYIYGFQGPAMTVDTACSSSLVAIHLACEGLRDGSCDQALAAGVNIICTEQGFVLMCRTRALAFDGHCKTFDKAADGYARGEGCGVIVLKRLSDAKKDGDNILAIIKGSAVNQDGQSTSFTAPNGVAQQELISMALENANVKPNEVSYIEAHGTGTPLGDPTEVSSLAHVYSEGRNNEQPLILGTVKTNIGHLESAAGVASVIKVVLAMQHKQIPAHLNFHNLNPEINLDEIPAQIPMQLMAWPAINGKMIAGVSSFGISGTNAHIIIEEAPVIEGSKQEGYKDYIDRPANILAISAKSIEALQDLAKSYIATFAADKELLANVCYTAATSRAQFKERLAVIANNPKQAQEQLQRWLDIGESIGVVRGKVQTQDTPKLAFLFTGQGSQYVGMGKLLYETQPRFKQELDNCAAILSSNQYLDKPLTSLLWGDDSKLLDETKYTQPTLFALEYSLYQLLNSWGIIPQAVMGHSVGEYVAATVAGVFSLEDGLKLICKRAALMQALPQNGAMAAIAVSEDEIKAVIAEYGKDVSIAAVNGPTSVVISGDAAKVKDLVVKFDKKNIKTNILKVSHAFHSHLLEPMLDDFAKVLADITFNEPAITLVSNLTGDVVDKEQITTAEYWLRHTMESVRFADGVRTLIDLGFSNFVEIGSHPVLLAMAQECVEGLQTDTNYIWTPTLRRESDDWREILTTLGNLYLNGVAIDWNAFDSPYIREKVQLPTYPFQRKRYWVDIDTTRQRAASQRHPLLGFMSVSSIHPEETTFNCDLNLDLYQYLIDHQVYGNVIIPGAAYVEMALSGANEALSSRLTDEQLFMIEILVIEKPLILMNSTGDVQSKSLQMIIELHNEQYTFKISSKNVNDTQWVVHASGSIAIKEQNAAKEQIVSMQDIQARCKQEISSLEVYNRFAEIGLEYGVSFQGITKLYAGDNEALGEVRVAQELKDKDYIIHPAVLDAVFQVMLGLNINVDEDNKGIYLPFEIDQITLHHAFDKEVFVHVIAQESPDARVKIANLNIYSKAGALLLEIVGFNSVKASSEELQQSINAQIKVDVEKYLYEFKWREQALDIAAVLDGATTTKGWIIFADNGEMARSLAERIQAIGDKAYIVNTPDIEKTSGNPYAAVLTEVANSLKQDNVKLERVVYLFKPEVSALNNETFTNSACLYERVMLLTKVLAISKVMHNGCLCLVTMNAQWVNDSQTRYQLEQSPLIGLGRVIAIEHPELNCRRIDLDLDVNLLDAENIDTLFKELNSPISTTEDQVAFRQGIRFVPRFVRCDRIKNEQNTKGYISIQIQPEATYLITGGLGALGLEVARWLVNKGAKHLALIGRRVPGPEVQTIITNLESDGVDVKTIQADIAKFADVENIFQVLSQSNYPLIGIIHAAGVLDDAIIMNQNFDKYLKVIAPKILGGWNLQSILEKENIKLDFFVSFSSVASMFGNVGQCNYAAANAFLDALSHYQRQQNIPGIAINWGAWAQIGLAANVNKASQEQMILGGVRAIAPKTGIAALEEILLGNHSSREVAVWDANWQKFLEQLSIPFPIFAEILKGFRKTTKRITYEKNNELIQKLISASSTERTEILAVYLESEIKMVLGMNADTSMDRKTGISDLGMDSLMVVEFRNRLTKALGSSIGKALPATILFNYPNIETLTQHLLAELLLLEEKSSVISRKTIRKTDESIAIIGMSCRFPGGINNPDEFWKCLDDGRDLVKEPSKARANSFIDKAHDSNLKDKKSGYLESIDEFDAKYFNFTEAQALSIDPQQRIFLEVMIQALENAGIPPSDLTGNKCGAFVSTCYSDYTNLFIDSGLINSAVPINNSGSGLIEKLSRLFNFRDQSCAVDASCASSLVALQLGCESLLLHNTDIIIVGGVNLLISEVANLIAEKANLLSPTDSCKTFDIAADGFVRGEGCGVVILKRLGDAIADNNKILAIVKAVVSNQNGLSMRMGAPNGLAQTELFNNAIEKSGITPNDINYIESHGVGTIMGDAMEIDSLQEVYNRDRDKSNPLIVGSVKPNIGHLEGTSGMASLIKVIKMMEHKVIPKLLNLTNLNPDIDLSDGLIQLPLQRCSWESVGDKRRAGISSFGFSGANAHLILEEPDSVLQFKNEIERPGHVLCLSAVTTTALSSLAKKYLEFLSGNNISIADICFSTNAGRARLKYKLSIVCSNVADLQLKLSSFINGEILNGVYSNSFKSNELSKPEINMPIYNIEDWVVFSKTQPEFGQRILKKIKELFSGKIREDLLHSFTPGEYSEDRFEPIINDQLLTLCETAFSELCYSWDFGVDSIKRSDHLQISVEKNEYIDIWDFILHNLAKSYVSGILIKWDSFESGYHRKRVALPSYPFEKIRYWPKIGKGNSNE